MFGGAQFAPCSRDGKLPTSYMSSRLTRPRAWRGPPPDRPHRIWCRGHSGLGGLM